jgi:cytidine deaminase
MELVSAGLSTADSELANTARDLVGRCAIQGKHHVACAVRDTGGSTFTGIHLSANIGVSSVCAEAVAIADLAKTTGREIDSIVSARWDFRAGYAEVVPPCGRCRELIAEYGPRARVILADGSRLVAVPISELIPRPFLRRRQCVED